MSDYGDELDDADAILALLRAQSDIVTYPPEAGGPSVVPPNTAPPYRVVHFHSEHTPVGQRMLHRSSRTITRALIHCVGANDIAARALVSRTREALLDVKVALPGRSVYPIRNEQTREAQITEPVAQSTVTITTIYRLEHEPGVDGS